MPLSGECRVFWDGDSAAAFCDSAKRKRSRKDTDETMKGFLLLVGASDDDTMEIADKMTDKICRLRIFADENGKTNLSLADVGGELLVVSQFTLFADCRKGNRPGFTGAGSPDWANQVYEHVIERCRNYVSKVEHGVFGADMEVRLVNDGPFTLALDSREVGIG